MTLKDFYIRNAKYFPQKTAFVFENVSYTFYEYNQKVNRVVNALSSLGVQKGDRIAAVLYNTPENLEIFGAAEKGGFVMVPLSPRLNPREVREIIDDAEAKVVIVGEEHLENLPFYKESSCAKLFLSTVDAEGVENYHITVESGSQEEPSIELNDNDLVYLIYTSGTTGKPKGVMIDHRSQIENNKNTVIEMSIMPEDTVLNCLPLNHIGGRGLVSNYFARGCTSYILEKFNIEQILNLISTEKITSFVGVPSMLWSILEFEGLSRYDFSSLHTIMYSGAPITKNLLQKSIENFGNVLIQFYGVTEAGAIMFVLPKADHVLEGPYSGRIRSAGIPVFNNQARVVDENGNDIGPGEVGEIIVKTPAVMQGYWKKPELTSETLRNGWLYTGDLGTIDEDNYVYIIGRKKDMIISGGENIYAREVEEVIASYRGVKEVAVIGVPHDKWGETVAALVVLEHGVKVTEDDIIDHSKKQLASYKKPTAVFFIDELPRNALGKVQKTVLKELYGS